MPIKSSPEFFPAAPYVEEFRTAQHSWPGHVYLVRIMHKMAGISRDCHGEI